MVSDYTPPPVTQATLKGAPYVTVSPVGLAQGYPKNNNANYGPDTAGTATCGIQEAINSGATSIELLDVPGYNFVTSASIFLPATYGIRLVGHAAPWNVSPNASYIVYGGTGFAIDTAAGGSSSYNVRGWIDGLFVSSVNGSGVRFTNVIYAGGYLAVVGGNLAGTYGIYFDALSFGSESTWNHLRIGGYGGNLLYNNQDHLIIDHLSTAFTIAGQDVVYLSAGWEITINSWHHFCSNQTPANGMTIAAPVEGVRINNLFWETSTYSLPTNLVVNNLSTQTASIGEATSNSIDIGPYLQNCDFLNSYSNTRHFRPLAATASVQQQNSETIALEASSWNTSTLKSVNQQALIQLQAGSPGNPPNSPSMNFYIPDTTGGYIYVLNCGATQLLLIDSSGGMYLTKYFLRYANATTAGLGIIPQYGLDNRTGLTAPDASPITLYTPANNGLYTVKIYLNASAYTSGTATYSVVLTARDGTSYPPITLSTSAANQFGQAVKFLSVKAGTVISAQLTGTFTATVDVGCVVEAHTAT